MKWLRRGANIIATVIGGFLLARWLNNLPYEFSPLPATVAFCMRAFGIDTIEYADDIEAIGLLVVIAGSLVVAALSVGLANTALRRLVLRT